jgi:hypothetical protein
MYEEEVLSEDGRRKIKFSIENDTTMCEFYEDGLIQMKLAICEDIKKLRNSIFKKRKYFWIFKHYLDNGMTGIDLNKIYDNLNFFGTYNCESEIVFHNINGIDICFVNNRCRYRFVFEQFGIFFKYVANIDPADYNTLNNMTKQDIIFKCKTDRYNNYSRIRIADKSETNEFGETVHIISYKGTEYSLLDDMYKRLCNPDYLKSRDLDNGGELFIVKEGQEATMAKNTFLAKEPPRFIKYIDRNGYIYV